MYDFHFSELVNQNDDKNTTLYVSLQMLLQ